MAEVVDLVDLDLDFAEALAAVEAADAASASAAAAAAPAAAPASKIVQLIGGKRPPITSAAALAASVSARAATEALLQSRLTSARSKFSAPEMAEALKRYEDRGKKWQLSLDMSAAEDPEMWWSVKDEYMDLYLNDAKLMCETCLVPANVSKWSDRTSHPDSDTHKAEVKKSKERKPQPTLLGLAAVSAAASSSAASAAAPDVRAALCLSAIRDAPPSALGAIYGRKNLKMVNFLDVKSPFGVGLGDGGGVARARARGDELLKEATKRLFAGKNAAILVDEANSAFEGRTRPLAIMLACSQLGKPVLADIIFDVHEGYEADEPGEDGVKWSTKAAHFVRKSLAELGIDINTQVTSLVADNATAMDNLAAELGLPRLRCLPHCLALVYAVLCKPFKRFVNVTCGLSAFIRVGGGQDRARLLRDAGLDPRKMNPQLHALGPGACDGRVPPRQGRGRGRGRGRGHQLRAHPQGH